MKSLKSCGVRIGSNEQREGISSYIKNCGFEIEIYRAVFLSISVYQFSTTILLMTKLIFPRRKATLVSLSTKCNQSCVISCFFRGGHCSAPYLSLVWKSMSVVYDVVPRNPARIIFYLSTVFIQIALLRLLSTFAFSIRTCTYVKL